MAKRCKAVFFDLDGTLADTAEDLSASINQLLEEHKKPIIPIEQLRPVISKGSSAMLQLGFQFEDSSQQHLELKQRLFEIYGQRNHQSTQLFPGMEHCLETLEKANITWGIVTNKLSHLAEPVVEKLGLEKRSSCLVCADTAGYPKPHPAPLLHAASLCQVETDSCVYVGDAKHDITAAKAADMASVVAAYGYIANDESIQNWQADYIIEQPGELLDWLGY